MKTPSDDKKLDDLRNQIIGLGSGSFRKNYYTALRKSYSEQERFRKIIDGLLDYIIILDENYHIIDSNDQANRNLNLLDNEGHYRELEDVLPNIYKELFTDEKEFSIWEGVTEHQGIREVVCDTMNIDNKNYFTLIFRDITQRIKNELHLEKLVEERTRDIQQAQKKLVFTEKMAALGELVAGVSHEINTPVGIGVTTASHLKELTKELRIAMESGKLTKSRFEEIINNIDLSADMLMSNLRKAADLVQSFKKVAVDQTILDKRTINIREYIVDITRSLHPKWKGYEMVIDGPEHLFVETIPGAWSQIVTNFVMNSITHGFEEEDGGEITISFKSEDHTLIFLYGDNGRGLGDTDPEKIYQPFYTTKRDKGGSGLGMDIIYNLVTKTLKGQIEFVECKKGLTFKITVPLKMGKL